MRKLEFGGCVPEENHVIFGPNDGGAISELRFQQIGADTFVSGDTNGDGTADFMIRVDGLHALTSGDFLL